MEQLEKLQKEIDENIIKFTQIVKKKLKSNVRAAVIALITAYVHYRDVNVELIREKVFKTENFKWQM